MLPPLVGDAVGRHAVGGELDHERIDANALDFSKLLDQRCVVFGLSFRANDLRQLRQRRQLLNVARLRQLVGATPRLPNGVGEKHVAAAQRRQIVGPRKRISSAAT